MIAIESIQKVSTLESELQLQVAKVYYFRVILAAGTLSIITHSYNFVCNMEKQ